MLAILLVLCSTLFDEVSQSIAKTSVRRRRETVYGFIFLEFFWCFVVMAGVVAFGGGNKFDVASWATLGPRVVIEILVAYLSAEAVVRVDRSTIGFLRLFTIPLLLVVDITLGYHLTSLQIGGVIIMFFALMLAFRRRPHQAKSGWIVVLVSVLSVAAISLFKYDITHYNSIAVEQLIVMASIVSFFFCLSWRSGKTPLRLLIQPVTGTQALSSGLSAVIASFAIGLAPASVITALKRTFALLWAVLFGRTYFHEHSFGRKLYSFGFTAIGIGLLVSPYWLP